MKTFSTQPGLEKTRLINCHICGGDQFSLHWDCGSFQFQKCRSCGVLLQNPQPEPQALIDRYDEEYFSYEIENEKAFHHLMELGLGDIEFAKRTASWKPEDKTFLDIGCATGMLLEARMKQGWQVKGVEVCKPAVEYGRKTRGVDIFHGTLEDSSLPEDSFGFIHFSHVIEHIPDPAAFLREVRRVCRKDGLVAITTPNWWSLQGILFRKNWRSAIADHVYLFSRKTLTQLLAQAGFRVLTVRTWGGLAKGAGPVWLKKILDPLAKKWGFGDVVMVLATPSDRLTQ